MGIKCYIKKMIPNTKKLKKLGWVEKPPGFNNLKSVTIRNYL